MKPRVYLAGLISTEFTKSLEWRVDAEFMLRDSFHVLSPMRGKQDLVSVSKDGGLTDPQLTSADIILRDFNDILRADVLLAHLDDFGSPRPLIGTLIELGWAWEHRKPVLAIADTSNMLMRSHPFIVQAITHYTKSLDEAVDVLRRHYS